MCANLARHVDVRCLIIAKWGLIARIWANVGRICMARRDEARHGTRGPPRPQLLWCLITSLCLGVLLNIRIAADGGRRPAESG